MGRHLKLYGLTLLMCLTFLSGFAVNSKKPAMNQQVVDSLWRVLAKTRTAKDSIPILYNIYDITNAQNSSAGARDLKTNLLNLIYDVGLRARDTLAAYDAVRNLAALSRYDAPMVDILMNRISTLPESTEKKETETFITLQRNVRAVRDTTLTEAQRRKNFQIIRNQLEEQRGNNSLYDRLNLEFALILYGGGGLIQSEQMEKYLEVLGKHVEQTKSVRMPLKSYFYNIAPVLYDENEAWEKSVEADRKMLEIIDNLNELNIETGRSYRNYDRNLYVIYLRMLSNFEYLQPGEPEVIYEKLHKLTERLSKHDIEPAELLAVEANWNMYRKNYQKALEQYRTVIKSKRFSRKPKYLLAYIKAAAVSGSLADLEKGQRMYTNFLRERAREAADTEYARMRIQFEMDTLESSQHSAVRQAERAVQEADMANEKALNLTHDFIIYGIIVIVIFLFALLVIQFVATRRIRKMANQLKRSNESLMAERDSLKKTQSELVAARDRASRATRQRTEFIHNVSHEISEPVKSIVGFSQLIIDSIPEERRKYLTGFMDIIIHNGAIIQKIVGDILDTAEFEDTVYNITLSHINPENICNLVADSMKPRLNENQSLTVEPLKIVGQPPAGDFDPGIDTDASRLEQILRNIVDNAIKFSDKGEIRLSSVIDTDTGNLTIAVEDCGPGIPKGKEEIIFERFEKLGHFKSGLGLGLFVCREIARLLNGSVKVDTSYRKGARLLITLPLRYCSQSDRNDKLS